MGETRGGVPAWVPAEIRDAAHVDLVAVVATFLRACDADRALLQRASAQRVKLKPPIPRAASRIEVAASRLELEPGVIGPPVPTAAAAVVPLRLSRAELGRICRWTDWLCIDLGEDEECAAVLRCRITAELLDARWGFRIALGLALQTTPSTPTKVGDPIPRIDPDLGVFEGTLATSAQRRDELAIADVRHLGLATHPGACFERLGADMLPVPHRDLLVAWFDPITGVSLPRGTPRSSDAELSITYQDLTGEQPDRFRVFPHDPEHNLRETLALLCEADACGAEIAIAPELTVGGGGLASIEQWLRGATHLRMVVCGSAHLACDRRRGYVNRTTTLLRRAGKQQTKVRFHDKFNPFDFPVDDRSCFEDIVPGPRQLTSWILCDLARVSQGASPLRWSYATMICKDLMTDDLWRLIDDAGVSMLLGPLMTPKTASLAGFASGASAARQTTFILANHDLATAVPAVLVVRPTDKDARPTCPRPEGVTSRLIAFRPFRKDIELQVNS
jgi:hypothetical protein